MKNNKKGFTLAELLIVVAIIAVLVAIAIPVFTSQLEKSREAVDLANLRSAYAECSTAVLTEADVGDAEFADDGSASKTVKLVQEEKGWEGSNAKATIAGKEVSTINVSDKGQSVTVKVAADGTPSFTVS